MSSPIVSLSALTQHFGEVVALDSLTLEVHPGVTGLVGANGAGKTTMLRILLGLIHPTAGAVTVLGHDARTDSISVRSRVGYMPEGSAVPKDQTAADFVAYAAELAGLPPKDARRRSSETLFLVGLEEERFRFLGDFSTGMLQRVKLAQSIVHGPDLVLLDEPASGLDPAGRAQMLALIRRLGGFGINVIVSSHVLSDIEETCDFVVMLDAGKLVRSGPLDAHRSSGAVSVEVIDDPAPLMEALTAAGHEPALTGRTVTVLASDDAVFDLVRDVAAGAGIGILRLGRTALTLEDEFLSSARGPS
ncbi:MAG TPA: ABC transporter ATP-binding protein [Acidimicrobiia bacterium]|nr:ABC transporter ATP-binding protein [Acidimicrobiia bacterium]